MSWWSIKPNPRLVHHSSLLSSVHVEMETRLARNKLHLNNVCGWLGEVVGEMYLQTMKEERREERSCTQERERGDHERTKAKKERERRSWRGQVPRA
jgi:hypothetical protein